MLQQQLDHASKLVTDGNDKDSDSDSFVSATDNLDDLDHPN